MAIKIGSKIVGYEVVKTTPPDGNTPVSTDEQGSDGAATTLPGGDPIPANVVQMHEKVERPEMLLGSTYKIKTPLSDHALYVTINDIVLNPDTPYEKRRPFE
ncbi:MAG: NrdJb, partial [Gammaproteobacteria bacterium]|nr:NrdJb [Gammaproteobacteria bacterium]